MGARPPQTVSDQPRARQGSASSWSARDWTRTPSSTPSGSSSRLLGGTWPSEGAEATCRAVRRIEQPDDDAKCKELAERYLRKCVSRVHWSCLTSVFLVNAYRPLTAEQPPAFRSLSGRPHPDLACRQRVPAGNLQRFRILAIDATMSAARRTTPSTPSGSSSRFSR